MNIIVDVNYILSIPKAEPRLRIFSQSQKQNDEKAHQSLEPEDFFLFQTQKQNLWRIGKKSQVERLDYEL